MPPRRLSCGIYLSLVFGLLLPGCGGPKPGGDTDARATLKEVAQLYRDYRDAKKRAPARLADLQPLNPVAPSGFLALETGDCVPVWGAGLSDAAGASSAVLVYEKSVPQQGGYVL